MAGTLQRHPAGAFRICLLHGVSRDHQAAFERLVQYILDAHGVLAPPEAEDRLGGDATGEKAGQTPYLFTFDDGYASNVIAGRVLHRYGVRAVFFVCPGLMDTPRHLQHEAIARSYFEPGTSGAVAPPESAVMTWSDLEELAALGHTVGSHSTSHRRLSTLRGSEREEQVCRSADLLIRRLGVPVRWFAFPFGTLESLDQTSCRLIAQHYAYSCSGIRGLNSATTSPWALLREQVDLGAPLSYLKFVLGGGLDVVYWRKAQRLQRLAGEAAA